MTPLAILTAARNLIATRGWTQDELEDSQGRLCMVGAIHAVIDGMPGSRLFDAVFLLLEQAITRRKYHNHYACIAIWNDTPGRTQRQVLNAFNRAIALAQAQAAMARAKHSRINVVDNVNSFPLILEEETP